MPAEVLSPNVTSKYSILNLNFVLVGIPPTSIIGEIQQFLSEACLFYTLVRKPWSVMVVHFCSRELVLFPAS